MAKTVIGWTILVFSGLVLVNYVAIITRNMFAGPFGGGDLAFGQSTPSASLKAIDFGTFDKGGSGRSYITQGWGRTAFSSAYIGDWHNGIDIAAAYGAPVYSPGAGIVIAAGNQDDYCPGRGFGRYVAVADTENKLVLWYAHLGAIKVAPGGTVEKGTELATVGSSGFETGTHLHFSIFDAIGFSMLAKNGCGPDANGHDLNPLLYLGSTYQ